MTITFAFEGQHMGRKRRHQPSDPAEIARKAYLARRDPALWGVNDDAMRLPANRDVAEEAATRTKVRRVVRFDCFSILLAHEEHRAELMAVRRYQDDLALLHGVTGEGAREVHVDNSGSTDSFSAKRLDAGKRLARIEDALGDLHCKVLQQLSEPTVIEGRQVSWKLIVLRCSGAVHPRTQAKIVREASASLSAAYQAMDQAPRKAA